MRDDRTGFRRYRSQCRKEWTGNLVASEQWEPRHPQEFIQGRMDQQAVPDPRPGPSSDTFIAAGSVTADDF